MFQTARSWWCEGQKKVFGGEAAESLLAVSGDTATLCHTWLWYSVVELKMLANRCYLASSSSDIYFRPNSQDQRTFNCVPFTRSKPVNWAKQQQELSQQPCCNANIDSANFSEILHNKGTQPKVMRWEGTKNKFSFTPCNGSTGRGQNLWISKGNILSPHTPPPHFFWMDSFCWHFYTHVICFTFIYLPTYLSVCLCFKYIYIIYIYITTNIYI